MTTSSFVGNTGERCASPLARARSASVSRRESSEKAVGKGYENILEVINPLLGELNGKIESLGKKRSIQSSKHQEEIIRLKARIKAQDAYIDSLETQVKKIDEFQAKVAGVWDDVRHFEDDVNTHRHNFDMSIPMGKQRFGPKIESSEKPTFI